MARRPTRTANWRRRSSRMASGKRASMREGPLAALFRRTDENASPDDVRKDDDAARGGREAAAADLAAGEGIVEPADEVAAPETPGIPEVHEVHEAPRAEEPLPRPQDEELFEDLEE